MAEARTRAGLWAGQVLSALEEQQGWRLGFSGLRGKWEGGGGAHLFERLEANKAWAVGVGLCGKRQPGVRPRLCLCSPFCDGLLRQGTVPAPSRVSHADNDDGNEPQEGSGGDGRKAVLGATCKPRAGPANLQLSGRLRSGHLLLVKGEEQVGGGS